MVDIPYEIKHFGCAVNQMRVFEDNLGIIFEATLMSTNNICFDGEL